LQSDLSNTLLLTKALAKYGRTEEQSAAKLQQSLVLGLDRYLDSPADFCYALSAAGWFTIT